MLRRQRHTPNPIPQLERHGSTLPNIARCKDTGDPGMANEAVHREMGSTGRPETLS
jgi:hypothetical protein